MVHDMLADHPTESLLEGVQVLELNHVLVDALHLMCLGFRGAAKDPIVLEQLGCTLPHIRALLEAMRDETSGRMTHIRL